MRCLSVADALAAQGADVEFVLSDDGPAGIIESRGYGTHSLGTDWRDITQGIDGLLVLCKSEEAPVVLVDTYSITKEFVDLADLRQGLLSGEQGRRSWGAFAYRELFHRHRRGVLRGDLR